MEDSPMRTLENHHQYERGKAQFPEEYLITRQNEKKISKEADKGNECNR